MTLETDWSYKRPQAHDLLSICSTCARGQ